VSGRLRFFDEHVPFAAAQGLRRQGIEVTTAVETGLSGADDEILLEFARQAGRLLVRAFKPLRCGSIRKEVGIQDLIERERAAGREHSVRKFGFGDRPFHRRRVDLGQPFPKLGL